MDLTSISIELSRLVPLESDLQKRCDLAESAIRCVLRTRILVKEAWEKTVGREITAAQWLLVQLHPVHFFKEDVFDAIAVEVFRHVKGDHRFRLPPDYLVAVDEAQVLSKILQGGFESSQKGDQPPSLRSLLSPVIIAVESAGRHPIIAGTGLSMLQTLKSAAGSTTAAANVYESIVFDSFPSVTEVEAEKTLKGVLDTSVGAARLKEACKWLVGRYRFLTRFLERALSKDQTVDETLIDFVRLMADEKVDSGTTRFLVEKLVSDQRRSQARVTFWNPTAAVTEPPIEVRDVFQSFKWAAWAQCNGEMVYRMEFSHATALVECGLATNSKQERDGLAAVRFEPLVLEAARKCLFDEAYLRQVLLLVQNEPTALGFRFEQTAPFLMVPRLFPLDGSDPFEANSVIFGPMPGKHSIPDIFKGVWRPFPVHLGEVAKRGPLFPWFKESLDRIRNQEPVHGLYPDTRAGPDYSFFLQKFVKDESADPKRLVPTAAIGIGHLQLKYAKAVDLEIAKRTVDPALFYHINRGQAKERVMNKYKKDYQEFLQASEGVPVFRIIVWVGSVHSNSPTRENDVTVEVVDHHRPLSVGSSCKHDLCVVFNRHDTLKHAFGDEFFHMIQKLKDVRLDEEEMDE